MFKKPETRADHLKGLLFINTIIIAFGIWLNATYNNYSSNLLNIIELQRPLLVLQLQQGALLFAWVPLIPALVVLNIEVVVVKILQLTIPPFLKIIQKISMWGLILGTVLLLFGNQLVNPYWAKTFSEAGYSRCQTDILPGAKNFFSDAWVLQAEDCYDPVLKQALKGEWGDIMDERGRLYLEEKHEFLKNYNAANHGG